MAEFELPDISNSSIARPVQTRQALVNSELSQVVKGKLPDSVAKGLNDLIHETETTIHIRKDMGI